MYKGGNMDKTNTCPKCGYTSETAFDECVKCGVVVAKFQMPEGRITPPPDNVYGSGKTISTGIFSTIFYFVRKAWLWPIPLVLIQIWVLITSDAIWTTEVTYVSKYSFHRGIAAHQTIFGFGVITLLYWLMFTPIITSLPEYGSDENNSEAMIKCSIMFLRVLMFSTLCFFTYRTVARFG